MHLSLQDRATTLIKASEAGQVECVKKLMDRGAKVNMQNEVSGVIYYVHAMHHKHKPGASDIHELPLKIGLSSSSQSSIQYSTLCTVIYFIPLLHTQYAAL